MTHLPVRFRAALTVAALTAVPAAVLLATQPAGAHNGAITITCKTVRVDYSSFPAGPQTATVVVNGASQMFSFAGPSGEFVEARPSGPVTVSTSWTADGGGSAGPVTDPGDECHGGTTTSMGQTTTTGEQTTTTAEATTTTALIQTTTTTAPGFVPCLRDCGTPTTAAAPTTTTVPAGSGPQDVSTAPRKSAVAVNAAPPAAPVAVPVASPTTPFTG